MGRILLGLTLFVLQALRFEPVQPELFGQGGTFVNAWADYDGDGDPDLFVGFDGTPNRLYRNSSASSPPGAGFVDVASDVGVADARPTRAAAWGDFDADGDPDLAARVCRRPGRTGASALSKRARGALR